MIQQTRSRLGKALLAVALLATSLLVPASAHAVSYVRSVEYVEVNLAAGVLTASTSLTKGQNTANCVPFASASVTGTEVRFGRRLTDVYFETGPTRVTAQRDVGTGSKTISVGVFVVEFDPAFVNVHQGTFVNAQAAAQPTTSGIPMVTLAKAALVFYYRYSPDTASNTYAQAALAGWFSSATQLDWQRNDASLGNINGHYYVFEAKNAEFSVQALSFGMAATATSATAPIPTPVDPDKTFVIASYRTGYPDDDTEDGQFRAFLSNATTLATSRTWGNGSGVNAISDIRAFVVQLGGNVRVQRGALSYGDADTQKTATIQAVRTTTAMVWNGLVFSPGAMEHGGVSSFDADDAFQRLKLANATTVQGDRGGGPCDGTPLDCNGVGSFEVVDFDPPGQMRVKSGKYTGNATAGKAIHVGFRPDAVFVKRAGIDPQLYAVLATSSMPAGFTKSLDDNAPGGLALATGLIQSLDPSGFTVGSDPLVNESSTEYHWVAFRAAAGEMKVGQYMGIVAATQSIAGIGFQPEYVIVLPAVGGNPDGIPVSVSSTFPADTCFEFDSSPRGPNGIRALEMDGFQVGTGGVAPLRPNLNAPGVTFHYIAWNAVPGRMAVGTYAGNGAASHIRNDVGFFPEWVIIKQYPDATTPINTRPWTTKSASTGVGTDGALRFSGGSPGSLIPNSIESLRPLGFELGFEARVNSAAECGGPCTYHWVAFGPHLPQINYRSIGTAANDTTGTLTATNGSPDLVGAGTAWLTNNRGRGDVITICDDPPGCASNTDYVVESVGSNASLRLTTAYAGPSGALKTFTLQRQFVTLAAWEDCIDGLANGGACSFFPPTSDSLVSDDRSEVGIAYRDSVFNLTAAVDIDGRPDNTNTDATHTITLSADFGNRHSGLAWDGVGSPPHVVVNLDGLDNFPAVDILDNFVTVEWLEIRTSGAGTQAHGIKLEGLSPANRVVVRHNMIHATLGAITTGNGIYVSDGDTIADIYNNIVYEMRLGLYIETAMTGSSRLRILNNTVVGSNRVLWPQATGIVGDSAGAPFPTVLLRNNLSHGNVCDNGPGTLCDFDVAGRDPASSHNLSSDATATTNSPAGGGLNLVPLTGGGGVNFVSTTAGSENLHLQGSSFAIDKGATLSTIFTTDVDFGVRTGTWDIGADEFGVTTAVKLMAFEALPQDTAVLLTWRTGSELDNLGFHLHRGLSENGPWTRLTSSLIPGLGSSPIGRSYSLRDAGLTNGIRYFYRLEDIDTASRTTSHGPVSAVPVAASESGSSDSGTGAKKKGSAGASCPDWVLAAYASVSGSSSTSASLTCTRHGDPDALSLGVVSRDSRSATLELRTGGFYALHESSGRVRVFIPGFDFPQDPQAAALPLRRALIDAVVGRRVQLGGVRALDLVSFKGLVPSALGKAEMQIGRDGTVRAARRAARTPQRFPALDLVKLLPSVFQGENKSAVVQIAPLRFDAQRQQLLLARRVLVRLLFTGRETGESGKGSFGRAPGSRKPVSGELLAQLYATSRGLYSASFEQLFPGRPRGFAASQLRLERQGEPVGFHLEPSADAFGPGSRLSFFADKTAGSTDFSAEVAYELVRSKHGLRMPLVSVAPSGDLVSSPSTGTASFETNRFYQPGLLDAPDPWVWESLPSGTTRVRSFSLTGVEGAASGTAKLDVFLQGASESGQAVDHHVSLSLSGVLVGEAQFAGKKPYRVSLSVPVSLLREGTNDLSLTNVADTGVASFAFLDRFSLAYPQASSLAAGVFEGTWAESGTASVSGVSGALAVLDVTGGRWLTGFEAAGGSLRFQAEAGRRYLAVSQEAQLSPRIARPEPSTLRATTNQADYLLIAPRAFLAAAEPLLQRRSDQGLHARAVSFEEIVEQFGHGQPSADAIRSFLAFAYHSWARPSPRYVALLGDSTYDPRNFIGSSQPSPLPALWAKTSYLWTVSDPQLAAVNGEDSLPDIAIGRLPATTVEEAQTLVDKLLAWEDSAQGLSGAATLVADNPDLGGDFEANVGDIAQGFLQDRSPELLLLRELGAQTRPRILDALNAGLSLLSYVGHGGAAVWASENVWNSWDAASLQAQSRQPLLLTMNCLNGYFVAPAFDSLSESLLKPEGRGAIAAVSPSGLSLDGPAHEYHRAVMAEITSGRHARLGDALLAAQIAYGRSGLMPELLAIYHLLGDPAMMLGGARGALSPP